MGGADDGAGLGYRQRRGRAGRDPTAHDQNGADAASTFPAARRPRLARSDPDMLLGPGVRPPAARRHTRTGNAGGHYKKSFGLGAQEHRSRWRPLPAAADNSPLARLRGPGLRREIDAVQAALEFPLYNQPSRGSGEPAEDDQALNATHEPGFPLLRQRLLYAA